MRIAFEAKAPAPLSGRFGEAIRSDPKFGLGAGRSISPLSRDEAHTDRRGGSDGRG